MRLSSPTTSGKITVTDNSIAPKPRSSGTTPASGGGTTPPSTGGGGTTPPSTGGGGTTPTPGGGSGNGTTPKPTTAKGWKGMSTAGKAMGVLGAAGGAYGIYKSTSGQGEHGAMNVVGGTASGAIMGASIGSMVPVIGTAIGAIGGAIIGGVISGSQLFSETDCLHDPVTGKFTCCNTVFNKGERWVAIGGYMFCGKDNQALPPGVRQCLQGGKAQESSWWDSLWEDDEWSKECTPQWCAGQEAPASGTDSAAIVWLTDQENICWGWDCAEGFTKSGNTCTQNGAASGQPVPVDTTTPSQDSYDKIIQKVQALRQQMQNDCTGE